MYFPFPPVFAEARWVRVESKMSTIASTSGRPVLASKTVPAISPDAMTSLLTLAVLFAAFGSAVVVVTEAVFVTVPVLTAATTSVTVAVAPLPSVPRLHESVPAPPTGGATQEPCVVVLAT